MKRAFRLLYWTFLSITFQQCYGQGKPLVDVRFDAPFQQIENSMGDEWAPTWASDDTLYTGCDDGSSFGGVPVNPITFGKLVGNDPYHLQGTTINGMKEFREGKLFHEIEGYTAGDVTYRLAQCDGITHERKSLCLVSPGQQERLFSSGKFQAAAFIEGDKAAIGGSFGVDAGQYVFAVAHAGLIDGEEQYFLARVPSSKLAAGNGAEWSFMDKDGAWVGDPDAAAAMVNERFSDSEGANWKITNSYSITGTLYMFIARIQGWENSRDPKGRLIFKDASVVKSTDQGRTWTRSAEENRRRPMFPGQRFGAPYFVWYGKDGAASADNADKFVYAISNDGYWESGDNYIIGRVPREKLPALSAADWTFFRSGDGMKDGSWTSNPSSATPVLSDPEQAGMTGVTYIAGLGRYVLVAWHYPSHGVRDVSANGDTRSVLEFFEAPHPWGPWTRFKTYNADGLAWYTPIIGQRFQTVMSRSTVRAFIYLSSLNWKLKSDYLKNYKLNYIPITLSTHPLKHTDPTVAGAK